MSGRRSRGRLQGSVRISDNQILELLSKLQQLLPESCSDKASASEVLRESCNYIQNLQKESEDTSQRLSAILGSIDNAQAAVILSLLKQ